MFNSLCLMVENLRICNCGLAHQQNLRINHKKFAIADGAQEFADLKKPEVENLLALSLSTSFCMYKIVQSETLIPCKTVNFIPWP
jgi:hypothetical protein